ncbi:MAG: substrate-binding domain-containing protein [Pseudothermotoga sp.]
MNKFVFVLLLILSCVCVAKQLILATTTSVYNTGLLDFLKPQFEKQYGHSLSIVAVGTGMALEYGKRADADILLVHSPDDELLFMKEGHGVLRVSFMYNDFVIVGPDEKAVPGVRTVQEFFDYIYENKLSFVSRADESGTHKKEKQIWTSLNKVPSGAWYIQTGQDMARTLMIADEKRAFALTDRSTFLALKNKLNMKIFFEGDPQLLNIYSLIVVNPSKSDRLNYEGALDFVRFILDPATLKKISTYSTGGTKLFNLLFEPK